MEEDEDPSTPKKQRRKRKPKNVELDTPVDSEEEIEGEEKKKKRGRKKKKVEPALDDKEELTDVQQIFQIVEHLMSSGNATAFLSRPDDTNYGMADYYEIISKPMWFKEVERRYRDEEYHTATEVAADIRQMLENCYQYWGPNDQLSKKALKIEQMFETKLASLPESLQEQCSLVATHGNIIKDEPDEHLTRKNNNKKGGYVSKLMNWVLSGRSLGDGDTAESTKELDATAKARKAEREAADKQLTLWELDNLLTPGVKEQIASMWEFPVIGQFLHLVYNVLNIDPISHLELERMFLMPQASKTLATLLTSMLIPPLFRAKLEVGPAMPYSIWSRRLHTKVTSWYRTFRSKGDSTIEVFDLLGIEPQFWLVMGEENPLNDYEFHELTFLQRVWLLKALCDFLLHNHKTIQECINNLQMKELRNKNLGRDKEGFSYHYFPMFPELRIYKMAKVPDAKWKNYEAGVEEAIAMCAEEEDDEDMSQEPNLLGLTRRPLHKPPRSMRPSHSDFRLVCETLEDVRRLVDELCEPEPPQTEGLRRLVANLRGILRDLESREAKMQLAAFNVRNRMRDEWIQFNNKSADYVDPGLAYWERKEKEEKKAGEEKLTDMSMPGTSSDGALPNEDKRERRTRRESSLKLLSREDEDDESAAESLLDFDDDSEDEWFASKKDKEIKKKKRSLSVKKLKKLSDLSDRMQHSTAAKDKLNVNSSSISGSKSSIINTNIKVSDTANPPVKIKQELPDFDEIANNIQKRGHNNLVGNQNNSNKSSNDSTKNKPSLPMPIKQEIIDEPPVTTLSSPTIKNTTSVIQTLVPVKVEKLTKPSSNTPDLSKLKRSNSPDDVVYISDSEDPPDVKPNPALLMQRVNSNKVETINYSMSVPQQQQVGGFLVAGTGQNPGQFMPVNVTPGDQVFNSQPQLFNVAQPQQTQPVAYQMQTPAIVQQPIIRPSPTIVRMQATPPRAPAPGQKFMVIQSNANNVNPSNQFSNKNTQPQGNSFPTTPTMQSVNWFGPRGAQQNFSPRQRGQSMVSPRGRGSPRSPMTPPRGGQRFAVRTPPNSVRTPGSVIRTPTQMGVGVRSPAQLRGRGATTPVRPSPVRNLNFNRSPVKPGNDVAPRDNSPDIEGTLVVSMTESGAFGYVVMLPDGGKISLTQDQLAKIRSDNGGTLPKTCKVPLNMQSEGFRID